MSNEVSGNVAFITGASKGIGLETVRGLGKLGLTVVIGSRDEAKGRAEADQLRSEGIERVEAVFPFAQTVSPESGRQTSEARSSTAPEWPRLESHPSAPRESRP